eukprot:TRINITY_DN9387_c0_g1_i1.p3 TRINITY_DN9387_c0_g1~~TRINITY_DN9387_c0_g1_i1.p3  ORF type:complete len:60 (+),score=13.16 TRINITY_DN9387_c0_g1_i1:41-220(+)
MSVDSLLAWCCCTHKEAPTQRQQSKPKHVTAHNSRINPSTTQCTQHEHNQQAEAIAKAS